MGKQPAFQELLAAYNKLLKENEPRFTSYRELTDEKSTYVRMVQKMAEDKNRNRLIIKDVSEVLKEGRSLIVFTANMSLPLSDLNR